MRATTAEAEADLERERQRALRWRTKKMSPRGMAALPWRADSEASMRSSCGNASCLSLRVLISATTLRSYTSAASSLPSCQSTQRHTNSAVLHAQLLARGGGGTWHDGATCGGGARLTP
jgi:hypothetical protein